MERQKLDKIFKQTNQMPNGNCPLPEPGRGAPVIEHTSLMSIEIQPIDINVDKDFSYDRDANKMETERFRMIVMKALEDGKITQADAEKLLKAELN